MNTLIDCIRSVIGSAEVYNGAGQLDYGLLAEYIIAGAVILIVVNSVFRFLVKAVFG